MSAKATHPHGALALLTVIYAVNFVDRQILSSLVEPLRAELHLSDTALGFLTGTAFALFYTLAGIPIGRWIDRGSRRGILALGLALWSLLTAASGAATSFLQLALLRVGVGVGEATCSPAAHSLISDLFPERRRGTALAVYSTGIHAGILFGFVLGGTLVERFGWRGTLAVVGLPGILLAVAAAFLLPDPPRGGATAPVSARLSWSEAWRALAREPSFRWLALGAGLVSITGYAYLQWSAALMQRVHGMGPAETGTALGLVKGLCGAAGTLLGGILSDRLAARDPRWRAGLPALCALLAAPCYAAFALSGDPEIALLWLAIAQVLSLTWLGPIYALAQSLVRPELRAFAAAVLLFAINLIGLGIGPELAGFLSDILGSADGQGALPQALAWVALAKVLGAAAFARAARGSRPER